MYHYIKNYHLAQYWLTHISWKKWQGNTKRYRVWETMTWLLWAEKYGHGGRGLVDSVLSTVTVTTGIYFMPNPIHSLSLYALFRLASLQLYLPPTITHRTHSSCLSCCCWKFLFLLCPASFCSHYSCKWSSHLRCSILPAFVMARQFIGKVMNESLSTLSWNDSKHPFIRNP